MTTYKVIRFYQRHERKRVIARGLTLEEAQEHCHDLNSSSSTCWKTSALKRTRRYGPWFDGYDKERV